MTQIVPISYLPDMDTWWGVNPGAIASLQQFAPLARGSYGTVGSIKEFAITGTDYWYAKMFRQTSGSTRLLVFRTSDIDEYSNSGTRTNRGTSYSASTAGWTAAGFGNAVVACNYLDDTQISTGTTFSAISSGCPKARLVAANSNFTMLADYNDGSNQYSDGWWCSAIGNVNSWSANLATQAANGRILDVSGPIRALVSYRDGFIAFKDNSIHVMEYVGPPYIWSVRTVSNSVGAHGPRGVCELRGVLYFVHSSGLYAFDGANVVSIGDPVENTFMKLANEGERALWPAVTAIAGASLATAQVVADDVENVVWFNLTGKVSTTQASLHSFGYNVAARKWGYVVSPTYVGTGIPRPVVLDATHADALSFFASSTNAQRSRVWALKSSGTTSGLYSYAYPYQGNPTTGDPNQSSNESMGAGVLTTGMIGQHGQALRMSRVYWHLGFSSALLASPIASLFASGYKSTGNIGTASVNTNGTINTEFDCGDLNAGDGPFMRVTLTTATEVACELYGIGFDTIPAGRR